MKKSSFIIALSLSVVQIVTINAIAGRSHIIYQSLEEAIKKGDLALHIKANGDNYSGECIKMELKNNKQDSCFYYLEAGRRLKSLDTTLQDMLVAQSQYISIRGKGYSQIKVFAFCCQVHHHAPQANAIYGIGKIADSNLVLLAKYLDCHRGLPICTMQYAVWTISDNNDLSSVTSDDMDSIRQLLDTLSNIKHVIIPWYTIQYEKSKNQLFSNNPITVSADIRFYLANNSFVWVNIYDANGVLVEKYSQMIGNPQTYFIPLSLNVRGWSHGEYSLFVIADDNIIIKKKFEL